MTGALRIFRRKNLLRLLGGLLIIGLPLATAIAAAIPGPHRLACPTCYGLRTIAPHVHVDPAFSAADERRFLAALKNARRRISRFFGPLQGRPTIVACKTDHCLDLFGGGRAKAVAYAYHAIRMAPSGLNATIAAHELSHVELHYRLGLLRLWRPDIPSWFDEGLATILSGDRRLWRRVPRQQIRAIMQVRTFSDWRSHSAKFGWRVSYGAAAAALRSLDHKLGRDGLRNFVMSVFAGADFETELARVGGIR